MKRLREQNKNKLKNALITRIPATYCYYNSVNIAVGRQNSGKTYSIIEEIINISKICPNTHMLIYPNKTGLPTDTIFETLKEKIQMNHKSVTLFLSMITFFSLYLLNIIQFFCFSRIYSNSLSISLCISVGVILIAL